ncbi:RE1-silencing transcription factor-like [Centroberyx affinis]|uniref:RE1-silencing transcription factor-like n=1 Tax=Centroberyx affinis TaxID=166261 RepID=UPI003A5C2DA0
MANTSESRLVTRCHICDFISKALDLERCGRCKKLKNQDELPELETVQELARWNVTKIETFTLATSPPSSPSKTPEMKEPELKSREEGYTCKQCRRTFMSLTGLRVHEHSHAAMAALKRLDTLPTSSSKHIFNKYIRYQSGTVKPFRCGICSYRTTIMGLLRSHLMKKHGAECSDISMSSAETDNQDEESNLMADKEPPYSSDVQEFNCLTQPPDESEFIEKSMYSEPPDVQRQLNHYSLMAKVSASAPAALQDTKLPEDSLLHCEFCNFSTGHLSSIRRHYSNRHGKKILRCKDCCFFTGLRKTLEMHMETGHSNCPSEPTHLKDLRCPLCLYQTKNKNNMIDHIVLHREERVMAIEVRRPKLSRYLEGVIFRCHKCTFTSANAENLRLHMLKHDDIKPYKCRLCYFDCTQLSDLEAHLCDKHQVVRNHELVGQINLDQLETMAGKMHEEEDALSNFEQQNNEADDIGTNFKMQGQEVEMENTVEPGNVSHENQEENTSNQKNEDYVVKLNEVPHEKQAENLAENDIRENVTVQNKELHQKQGQDTQKENTESPVKSTALVFQYENNAKQNNIVHQKQEQETQGQAGDEMFLADTANGKQMENIEQKGGEGNRAKIDFEEGLAAQNGKQNPKKEGEMDENPSQHNPSDSKEDAIKQTDVAQQGQETVETAQASKLHMKSVQDAKVRMQQNIETKIEDDILRQILVLDEEGSVGSLHNSQKGCEVKTEVMPATPKQNHMLAKDIRPQECSTAERLWLTAKHNRERVKICLKKDNNESLGVSFISCKEEQVHGQRNNEELADPYGEMPVLENEYLKEEMHTHDYQTPVCKEEEWGDYPDQNQEKRDEKDHEENMNQCKKQERGDEETIKEADYPLASNGAFTATDEVLHPSSKDEKLFACKFCGRNLIDSTELERHIMRHGM